ncbi:hypothetical protein B0H14DRAFT_3883209 [Mycena olivaceomarginata]|nr:hypothetical protein B0H14DRAFT_3883209 [Mycena olivaceomarginata]
MPHPRQHVGLLCGGIVAAVSAAPVLSPSQSIVVGPSLQAAKHPRFQLRMLSRQLHCKSQVVCRHARFLHDSLRPRLVSYLISAADIWLHAVSPFHESPNSPAHPEPAPHHSRSSTDTTPLAPALTCLVLHAPLATTPTICTASLRSPCLSPAHDGDDPHSTTWPVV